MKPSVGRIVHFYRRELDPRPRPRAAIITGVDVDGDPLQVALTVFEDDMAPWLTKATFSDEPAPGCWCWPPRV